MFSRETEGPLHKIYVRINIAHVRTHYHHLELAQIESNEMSLYAKIL